jgi:sulfite exporter TauE/SafE
MELLAAFLLGLGSAPHCMAMCGGIASALLIGARQQTPAVLASDQPATSALGDACLFGSGKLLGYMCLGLLAGTGGYLLTGAHQSMFGLLRGLAGILMILMGVHTAGWWRGLSRFERLAFQLWAPLLERARALRLDSNRNKLLAGVFWGFLPCGIVYTVLLMAMTSGSLIKGMMIMLVFGIGTMPFVLAAGGMLQMGARWLRATGVRTALGLILISFGAVSLMMAIH